MARGAGRVTVVASPPPPSVEQPLHRRLGLTDDELEAIQTRLGRRPNDLELAMFSVMWSEHCSYKSSRSLLRQLPSSGPDVLAGPGENAGAVRIGGGLAACFKIESHNHPSAVEPYQGAATGVGGILRDIVAMGARPVALLDALKFGDPAKARTRALVRGVVRGVGGYGNCVGVPTVGGELAFHPSYADNPLVNVMCVGLVDEGRIASAAATGAGNLAVLYGSPTGRDGIGGASVLASASFDEGSAQMRPSVQIGDPFAGKLLIEASLELIERGLLVGLQDLGAAGLTCAAAEMADKGGSGMRVDLAAVPRREEGMEPFEVMISESQERMLAVVTPERLDEVLAVCARWGLPAAVVGTVAPDGDVVVVEDGRELARVPARALASEAVVLERVGHPPVRSRPAPAPGVPALAHDGLPERGMDPGAVLQALLGMANLGSRAWVTAQYDETVGTDTVAGGARGAAVLRLKGTPRALVMATDSLPGLALHDPRLAAAMAVAECTRNVAVTGARPLGLTNCLNFGDPGVPEAFWQLSESVRGLAEAATALGLPVTGGNVSLYNESVGARIAPTAQIGVVGVLDDIALLVGPYFRNEGDVVALLGEAGPGLSGSQYEALAGAAPEDGPPLLDLAREVALGRLLRRASAERLLSSAQDVAGGGLAVAIAECALWSGLGADLVVPVALPPAVVLFGESPGRVVVSLPAERWPDLARLAAGLRVPCRRLGSVAADRLRMRLVGVGATGAAEERGAGVADEMDEPLAELERAWRGALPRALGEAS
ncbi:MAG TPA: phosphoribosylformylglycinamidine synthase subunit PurL [Candidatus Limnocylindria bacterium]|nr:phosphoribosylformylglycinamidine synthase subunit PurL [Candidatus Limnocylindria bacterium]